VSFEHPVTIKNFRQINDWFFRGGQPEPHEFEQLAELGIKTIICLRWSSNVLVEERDLARQSGMNAIFIPLNYWSLPTRRDIGRFFEIIDDDGMRPVFLHCKHGSDRTGMLASFYRMARDGWSADQAYEEMKMAGFHKIRMHHFKWAVYRFASRQIEEFK